MAQGAYLEPPSLRVATPSERHLVPYGMRSLLAAMSRFFFFFMSRRRFLEQLANANVRVADGEQRIARQKSLIYALNRDGPSGINAEEYLRFLESMQAAHVADRDPLAFELTTANPE